MPFHISWILKSLNAKNKTKINLDYKFILYLFVSLKTVHFIGTLIGFVEKSSISSISIVTPKL